MMGIVHKVEKQIKSALNFQNRLFNDASEKVCEKFLKTCLKLAVKLFKKKPNLTIIFFSMHLTDFRIVKILVEK